MEFNQSENLLTVNPAIPNAIPATPPTPVDDFDLLANLIDPKSAHGGLQNLKPGNQTINLWPLPVRATTAH